MTTETAVLSITCKEKGREDFYKADVDPECTGAEVIAGLVEDDYLTAESAEHPYKLVNGRTGDAIPNSASLVSRNVQSGDVITITSDSNGARS